MSRNIDYQIWGQDISPPPSYKVQVVYYDVPPHVKLEERWIDTPYRFKSYEDALMSGQRLFKGFNFRVTGSNDQPHYNEEEISKFPPPTVADIFRSPSRSVSSKK